MKNKQLQKIIEAYSGSNSTYGELSREEYVERITRNLPKVQIDKLDKIIGDKLEILDELIPQIEMIEEMSSNDAKALDALWDSVAVTDLYDKYGNALPMSIFRDDFEEWCKKSKYVTKYRKSYIREHNDLVACFTFTYTKTKNSNTWYCEIGGDAPTRMILYNEI